LALHKKATKKPAATAILTPIKMINALNDDNLGCQKYPRLRFHLMISIKPKNDFNHYSLYNFFIRALNVDNAVTSNTILMLLAGIRIAATIGDSIPRTANDKPTILYKMERIKLTVTMLLPERQRR